ncbi:MAG: diaminopimelate epimerase, partial [Leptospiraceae bacterium]|nr:diaminopimelate epimerase [Leptospiraceae bacterium]
MTGPSSIEFVKMEGIGNDYIFIDALDHTSATARLVLERGLNPRWIQQISDRHYGVGSDGVVAIVPPVNGRNQARMQMWNADGSPSAMCGNALRCIALYMHIKLGLDGLVVESETADHACQVHDYDSGSGSAIVRIDMGAPRFEAALIPFTGAGQAVTSRIADVALLQEIPIQLPASGLAYQASLVSMGNPHCVIFCPDADAIDLQTVGPLL